MLVVADDNRISVTATDLEVELAAQSEFVVNESGRTTLPGRKLLDILRALPEAATVALTVKDNKAIIRCGRSRFSLAILPAADWPALDNFAADVHVQLPQKTLRTLIESTHFAMAQQDVRYYLNGLLLELRTDSIRAVATDGHRLALRDVTVNADLASHQQLIVPRKGIQELLRLLAIDGVDGDVELKLSSNHIQIQLNSIRFTSKLIDGKFPDYSRAIPAQSEQVVVANRVLLRNALARAAILANDNRGVRLLFDQGLLRIQANNPEQEQAEDEIEVDYHGPALEIGFNVTYLLDALGALSGEAVELYVTDSATSGLLCASEEPTGQYVISPMRL